MTAKFALIATKRTTGEISFHPQTLQSLGIASETTMRLRYGVSSREIRVTSSSLLRMDGISLSHDVIAGLRIPLSSRFEIVVNENEMRLGPYIGFLVSQSIVKLEKNLSKISAYLSYYDHIGGTIIAFAVEGVNFRRRIIRGYVYNPKTKQWAKGTYSYPSSIFIKIGMLPVAYRKHFQSVLGDTIFNNFNYDKWRMYKLLDASGLGRYLPVSQLYQKSDDLLHALQRVQQTYIKPIRGSQGRSIIKISRISSGYLLKTRVDGNNHKRLLATSRQLKAYAQRNIGRSSYMVQRAIDLVSVNDRILDFRIIMVKNEKGEWQDAGLITRFGRRGSVVSNIKAGGSAEVGELTLRRTLGMSERQANRMRMRLSLLAHKVGRSLDAAGIHCGNMGVDIGIDTNGNVWIIEIQHNNPDHTLALDAGADRMFRTILHNNLLYLKWLAGFGRRLEEKAGIHGGEDDWHIGRNGTTGHD